MKFLADENIAPSVVKVLRELGHEVKYPVGEGIVGLEDGEIINEAKQERRIILTQDRDFGNLLEIPIVSHSGVIMIRLKDQSPANVKEKLIHLLKTVPEAKLRNALTILKETGIRIRYAERT